MWPTFLLRRPESPDVARRTRSASGGRASRVAGADCSQRATLRSSPVRPQPRRTGCRRYKSAPPPTFEGTFQLRVLVASGFQGATDLKLSKRLSENVITTQARVRIPLGDTIAVARLRELLPKRPRRGALRLQPRTPGLHTLFGTEPGLRAFSGALLHLTPTSTTRRPTASALRWTRPPAREA